jgi:hypothetical protein
MDAPLMLLGFNRAVGRFMGYESTDLGAAIKISLENPNHPDLLGLLGAELKAEKAEEDDLDEELVTVERYLALFEALNWGVSLDDLLTKDWPFDEIQFGKYWCDDFAGAGLIRGLRYARNAVHHDWSLALDVNPLEVLFQQRIELLWLCWEPELKSERPNPQGEQAYRENLAGRVVGDTLLEIGALFGAGTSFVLGDIPRHRSGPARAKSSPEDRYLPDEEAPG